MNDTEGEPYVVRPRAINIYMKANPLTPEQIEQAAQLFAADTKPSVVATALGISNYRARNLLKRHDVAKSVDRMRLTDLMPKQLSAILDAMNSFALVATAVEQRLTAVDEELRKVRTAMRRLQVENKSLRETRKTAREELREAKAALWRARGY